MKTDIKLHKEDLPANLKLGSVVACDCEFTGLNPPKDKLCLIQLYSEGSKDIHIVQFINRETYKSPNLVKLLTNQDIKKILKKRPSKEEIESSEWTSCCKGPVLKKDLEENLFVCSSCGKHHRISCRQRFDIFFGKNRYEILETPLPAEDPLNWKDTKSYKERLISARKKTGQDCAVMIVKGQIDGIQITAGAINFDFIAPALFIAS